MKRIKQLRENLKITQSHLAQMIGVSQQTIARWESGQAEPSLAALRDLALCLNTTVDYLVERRPVLEHQTTDALSWISGEESGYWGNAGILLKSTQHSRWYPISTSTMRKLHDRIQGAEHESLISFQTLNNKMVVFDPSQSRAITFLDEAEDEVDGDWEVGFGDVEGIPQEIYKCLEFILFGRTEGCVEEDGFSDRILSASQEIIKEHNLSEEDLSRILHQSLIIYNDGSQKYLTSSRERIADVFFYLDLGPGSINGPMLHFDDEMGDHSVYVPINLIALIEFPLLELERGMRDQLDELADEKPALSRSANP